MFSTGSAFGAQTCSSSMTQHQAKKIYAHWDMKLNEYYDAYFKYRNGNITKEKDAERDAIQRTGITETEGSNELIKCTCIISPKSANGDCNKILGK